MMQFAASYQGRAMSAVCGSARSPRSFGVQPLTCVHDLLVSIGLGNKRAAGNAAFGINRFP
jgi:hypothetical protein